MAHDASIPATAGLATSESGHTPEQIAYAKERYELTRPPLVLNNRGYSWISENVCNIIEDKTPFWWWVAFILSASVATLVPIALTYLVSTGVGVWGSNNPVFWAWDITNFVFWIGIGHAGTLISAILFLTRQKWRTAVNRASEAMTLFAVMCAGIFPAFHVGRVWLAWFLAPVPQANAIWPNFRSPLLWDVFAVSTYFTVSVLFWYTGLIPDFATLRDRCTKPWKKKLYMILSFGWTGSNNNWKHYEMAYMCLAGLSTPLVLSVHSVVSFDFATSVIPGWHTTIFPPYFVAGAVFGGFAMVLTILLPFRLIFPQLKDMITHKHVDNMCKIILLTGTVVGYAYLMELFIAWYSGNIYEKYAFYNRALGPYWWAYWAMMSCNVLFPQLFWSKAIRHNMLWVWIIVQFPNIGMWYERFVIIVTSIHRDFLPSSWGMFHPTVADISLFVGTCGMFLMLFLLFVRFFPIIAIAEVKGVLPQSDPHYHPPGDGDEKHGKGAH
jgi:Ni/Fe-hydrogenase subunit HybB-like protein